MQTYMHYNGMVKSRQDSDLLSPSWESRGWPGWLQEYREFADLQTSWIILCVYLIKLLILQGIFPCSSMNHQPNICLLNFTSLKKVNSRLRLSDNIQTSWSTSTLVTVLRTSSLKSTHRSPSRSTFAPIGNQLYYYDLIQNHSM